jgi:hypothetical protein
MLEPPEEVKETIFLCPARPRTGTKPGILEKHNRLAQGFSGAFSQPSI